MTIPSPILETATHWFTHGFGDDLDAAMRMAAELAAAAPRRPRRLHPRRGVLAGVGGRRHRRHPGRRRHLGLPRRHPEDAHRPDPIADCSPVTDARSRGDRQAGPAVIAVRTWRSRDGPPGWGSRPTSCEDAALADLGLGGQRAARSTVVHSPSRTTTRPDATTWRTSRPSLAHTQLQDRVRRAGHPVRPGRVDDDDVGPLARPPASRARRPCRSPGRRRSWPARARCGRRTGPARRRGRCRPRPGRRAGRRRGRRRSRRRSRARPGRRRR